ncbi:protein containing tetratricopeptide repeat [Lentimicrobium saccharophilum]|uniref:Protein containing tetratricopeptide repeat n=1 Tax=Lentimicrobium saccharophilum TaxID=1678841 RepID=A0A0S7C0W3_9BACT|nr:tetratricopeptide repeat protein [Lentimicrobium saccharophilum]GAP42784.1 protein containing tetratricopeptide repeat [Lentimicrobium saccharophilum]
MKKLILISFLALICNLSFGQKENPFIRKGNKLYDKGKFNEAEIDYRKAMEVAPASAKSTFNLGNSLYRQENYEEAERNFMNAAGLLKPGDQAARAGALHNLGNTYLKAEKYQESVEAYKQALRLNPDDEDTRYNLAYAQRKLMQQQQQQQQQQKNNDKEDNRDEKNQQPQQDQSDQQDQKEQQQQQKPQISKQDAERMLQALKNDEQKTIDKVNKQKVKAVPSQVEKDW